LLFYFLRNDVASHKQARVLMFLIVAFYLPKKLSSL
jgi:hypothetical protein